MHDTEALKRCCEQWRRWTLEEAAGISTANWELVLSCQARKQALRDQINPLIESVHASRSLRASLRSQFADLIPLEERNKEALARQIASARSQQSDLQCARRSLSQVRQAYSSPASLVWHSYS